jgi:hypothetical protein
MFSKRLQWGYLDVVVVDDDDEHVGGGGAYRRRFRQRFPPPNSSCDILLSLGVYVFDLYAAMLWEHPGVPF